VNIFDVFFSELQFPSKHNLIFDAPILDPGPFLPCKRGVPVSHKKLVSL
jgi:hypothetical protein